MFYILQWGGRDGEKTVGYDTRNLKASGSVTAKPLMRETVDYDTGPLESLESTSVAAKPLMIHLYFSKVNWGWIFLAEDRGPGPQCPYLHQSKCSQATPNAWHMKPFSQNQERLWFPSCQVELLLAVVRKKTLNFRLEELKSYWWEETRYSLSQNL